MTKVEFRNGWFLKNFTSFKKVEKFVAFISQQPRGAAYTLRFFFGPKNARQVSGKVRFWKFCYILRCKHWPAVRKKHSFLIIWSIPRLFTSFFNSISRPLCFALSPCSTHCRIWRDHSLWNAQLWLLWKFELPRPFLKKFKRTLFSHG